jgi:hypothetical protein
MPTSSSYTASVRTQWQLGLVRGEGDELERGERLAVEQPVRLYEGVEVIISALLAADWANAAIEVRQTRPAPRVPSASLVTVMRPGTTGTARRR